MARHQAAPAHVPHRLHATGRQLIGPARLYAVLAGTGLVVVGSVGFFYGAGFATGVPGVQFLELGGVLVVNGWLNLLHIALGLLGLAAAFNGLAARAYCLGVGAFLVVFAIWGFVVAGVEYDVLLDVFPVDPEGEVFHLVVGLLGVGAGLAAPDHADDSLDGALL